MASDELAVTTCYLEHLTDDDLALLCDPYGSGAASSDYRSFVRGRAGASKAF